MYEVNLVCPVCGEYKFLDGVKEDTFCCSECDWEGTMEEMETFVFPVK